LGCPFSLGGGLTCRLRYMGQVVVSGKLGERNLVWEPVNWEGVLNAEGTGNEACVAAAVFG
jgi:hypothetical protein